MSTARSDDVSTSELQTNPFDPSSSQVGGLDNAEVSTLGQPNTGPRPWGPWATLGWTLLCVLMLIVIQVAVLFAFMAIRIARALSTNSMTSRATAMWLPLVP